MWNMSGSSRSPGQGAVRWEWLGGASREADGRREVTSGNACELASIGEPVERMSLGERAARRASGPVRAARRGRGSHDLSLGERPGTPRFSTEVWTLSNNESSKVVQPRVPVAGRADRFSSAFEARET